jgi:radical SAM protein with 4Fe4S-binding SPASM domain
MAEGLRRDILPIARRYRKVILAGYGEPLLNPHLLPFLKELDQAKVEIGMSTNGTLLTESIARKLATLKYLVALNVSIDSPEEDSYRHIRGGQVEKALTGLKNLMAVIDEPQKVSVSAVLMRHNIKHLVHFPAILAKLGVRKFVLQGLVDYTDFCSENQLLSHRELFTSLDEIKRLCQEAGIEIHVHQAERLELERHSPQEARRRYHAPFSESGETRQCVIPWEIPFIDREGRVFPCCNASNDAAAVMGDLKQESWDEIWNGNRFRTFRQRLLDGAPTPAICQACNVAPRGVHPLLYAAKIIPELSLLRGKRSVKLVVKNISPYTWTRQDPIFVGTAAPRDRASQLWHPTWVSANRPASFQEKEVPPGSLATFKFKVHVTMRTGIERFELVYEGKTWLLNTRFTVTVRGKVRTTIRLALLKLWRQRVRFSNVFSKCISRTTLA